MTSTIQTTTIPTASPRRPSPGRRVAVAVTTFLTCALPVVFTINISRMLVTGELDEHRFHQLTGQGLILFAFWLGALLPLVRAGWRGDLPPATAALRHLSFVATGAVCAAAAPGGGAPYLVGLIAVTGALLWWALPRRPRLSWHVQVEPVLLPTALAMAAVLVPYAVDQVGLQNAASGHHAQNPHFFDMAWLVAIMTSQALLAALLPMARPLATWAGATCTALGVAGLALGESTGVFALVTCVGAAHLAARAIGVRRGRG
ncbi:MAG TPA: hypothetical protein VFI19_06970 [Nocardioides sp.]|nr:hypothetical protein [Nocardioides sp.]